MQQSLWDDNRDLLRRVPLAYAVSHGHVEMVEYLLARPQIWYGGVDLPGEYIRGYCGQLSMATSRSQSFFFLWGTKSEKISNTNSLNSFVGKTGRGTVG